MAGEHIFIDNLMKGEIVPPKALRRGIVNVPDGEAYSVLSENSGRVHIVPDLTADCTFSLPDPVEGLEFTFITKAVAADAQDWIFDTGADANFFLGGLTELDPSGGTVVLEVPDGDSNSIMTVLTPAPGTTLSLLCDGTNWILAGFINSDTADAVTWADQS